MAGAVLGVFPNTSQPCRRRQHQSLVSLEFVIGVEFSWDQHCWCSWLFLPGATAPLWACPVSPKVGLLPKHQANPSRLPRSFPVLCFCSSFSAISSLPISLLPLPRDSSFSFSNCLLCIPTIDHRQARVHCHSLLHHLLLSLVSVHTVI